MTNRGREKTGAGVARLVMAVAGALLLCGGISGCTLLPASEPIEVRRYVLLDPHVRSRDEATNHEPDRKGDDRADAPKGATAGHLYIRPAESNSLLASQRISFTRDGVTRGAYQYSLWVESPPSRVTSLLLRRLEQAKIFETVSRSQLPSDFILATELTEFVHDATSRPGSAVVELRAELIDGRKRAVLDTAVFAARAPLQSYDAEGAVEGFGNALAEVLDAAVSWVGERRVREGSRATEKPRTATER